MKKLTIAAVFVAALMLVSVSAFAAFSDMPQGEDAAILQKAVDNGLINGFEDGTIRPAAPITRAQMAAIMSRSMNVQKTADVSAFVDIKEGDWFYADMAKAVYMGAFKGNDLSQLNPNKTISRQEAFIVLSRIFDIPKGKSDALNKYSDGSSVANWAKDEVKRIASAGYLGDITALRPLEAMTRLEFAQIMDRIVTTYIDKDGEYSSLPEGNVLVRAQNVSFKGLVSKNVIFIGDGVLNRVNFDECDIERIVARGKEISINSGVYSWVRGVGQGTLVYIVKKPIDLLRKFEDGTHGGFYANPETDAVLIPMATNVDVN